MAMDLVKGSFNEKWRLWWTPKGRLIYPDLFEASLMKGETDQSRAAYRATLLFPKTANLDLLAKAVNDKVAEAFGATAKGIKKPFLKTADSDRLAELAADYPIFVRVSTRQKPEVATANGKPVDDPREVYGGRWAIISVNPGNWNHATGGKGISLYMNHVILLDHDDPLGASRPRLSDAFEPIEGADTVGSASELF